MMGPIKRMITLSMKKAIRQTALLLLLCMMTALVCAAAGPEYLIHTVVPGDTLGKIARQYDTTADAIAELNGIVNKNIIAVGDQLKIPGTAAETTAEFIAETEPEPEPEPEITLPNVIGDPDPDTGLAGIYEDMNTVVSVNFSRTDIRDVLSAFAVNLGCNVIFKGTATEISLVLSDVTIGEALDYVMKLVDMTYIIDGRTIIVGQKRDLIQTFSAELQVAEFNLQYVTAATVMQQIRALEIEVTATAAGDNEYRFIAKGLPADLSKVRDLIRMIDKRENSLLDPAAVSSLFYSIDLKHIRAQDLQRVLAATWLPTGVVLPDRPYTLYVYATADDYRLIMNICRTVDIEAPAGSDIQLPQIKQVSLRYVTLDLIEGQITANADVSIIKIATNKSTFWLNGMPAQLNKAAEIIALLDTEANMQLSGRDIKDKFRPVTLDFIDAARFSQVLEGLSLPSGLVFGDNPKTLYIYATADEFIAISEVKAVVDKAENDAGTAAVFRPVTLRHITAAQFNETLANLSLPTGIIFPNNDKTLFIYAAPDVFDSINDMQRVVDLPDNAADADTEFITVVLRHITAEQFNSTLAAVNLPTGIIYSDNEYTLYVHATREEEDAINAIKSVVDAPQNNLNAGSKFRYITLRFMTADQFNDTLREMSLPTGLTFTNNPYTLYLYSTASEYRAVNDIKNMVDAPQNALNDGAAVYPITLRYITAKQFNTVLSSANLPNGTYFRESDKTMFVNATLAELNAINNIKNTVDSLAGAASSAEFIAFPLNYISAEQFNTTLAGLSLPKGLIFPENKKILYLYVTPDELDSVRRVKSVVDTPENAAGSANRQLHILELNYISGDKFNTILQSMSLPTGVVFTDGNANMLYMYVTEEEWVSICDVKHKVDNPGASSEAAMDFKEVKLENLDKDFIIPFVEALGYDVDVIDLQNMQKVIWLKGSVSDVSAVLAEINKIKDYDDFDVTTSFETFKLDNISAEEMSNKLKALNLNNVVVHTDVMPALSRNILVSFPIDMKETIYDIIHSLDDIEDEVTLMIDSAEGTGGEAKLRNRITLIAMMSGIDESKFVVSGDITKTDVPLYVLYLQNATLAEIKRAREIVDDLASGSGGVSGSPQAEAIAAFNMRPIGNPGSAYEFNTGVDDTTAITVSGGFQLAETETTYELWYAVAKWAASNNFIIVNPGREGSDGIPGAAPTASSTEPVTDISWRDMIVWLNALSELKGLEPVYRTATGEIIRNANYELIDYAQQFNYNGYRLPTSLEWEMAARWNPPGWTAGNYASGAHDVYSNAEATGYVAWYAANSIQSTSPVRGKTANPAGLYDMSGNVWEWCFDTMGAGKVIRGGSFSSGAAELQVGYADTFFPSYTSVNLGFRIAKNP